MGTLWAIGRIALGRPMVAPLALTLVLPCLKDTNFQARGMALWCLGRMGFRGPIPNQRELATDSAPVQIYQDGEFLATSVGAVAANLVL